MGLHKIEKFRFWCQRVLPTVYEDSLSYYELLCKVIEYLNEVIDNYNEVVGNAEDNRDRLDKLEKAVAALEAWRDEYPDVIKKWLDENMNDYISKTIDNVYFGLTLDGRFVAYAPDSWSDIVFATGYDCEDDTYGRLILRMDVDSPYSVDQTHEKADWVR